ncbi:hypothetical protein EKD04_014235 [Chloroflexales bacterium ZM16-3]|nr:hypothetical protein [Chloroflexales bacterium ZM16-3]
MSSLETKKAVEYALAFATAGAGASFSIKTFVPIPVIDAVPQTIIVTVMANQLASIYKLSSLKGLTIFTGKIVGAAGGVKLASEVITFVPVAGPSTSAATSFAVHMSVGIVLIIVFELIQSGAIPEDFINNVTVSDMTALLSLAAEALGKIVRGDDGEETIRAAVEQFGVQAA